MLLTKRLLQKILKDLKNEYPVEALIFVIIMGSSNSRKSWGFFIKTLLGNANQTVSVMPDNVVCCYSCWQS